MTTSEIVPKLTLATAFGHVQVTPAEASIVLAKLASDLRDINPDLYQALMDASGSVLQAVENEPPTRSTSRASTST